MKNKPKGQRKPTLMDRLPKNEGERLEIMIHLTMRAAARGGSDRHMHEQADRLRAKLASWRQSNQQ